VVDLSIYRTVGLLVCYDRELFKKRLNRSRCRLGGLRWDKEPCVRSGSRYPNEKGQFWGEKWPVRDIPAVDIAYLKRLRREGTTGIRCGCRFGCTRCGTQWRHLVNTIEPSVCGGDAILWLLVNPCRLLAVSV